MSKYLLFLLLPTEDAFPLLVLLVPCFSEAAREQHFLSFLLLVEVGLAAELKICSASDLVFSSSPSSQHNSSLDTGNIYKLAKLPRNLIPLQSLSLELYSALDPVISAS